MREVKRTGGANIGWFNASWPFAKLSVTQSKIQLKLSMFGEYSFAPNEVASIQKTGWIPVLMSGVQIHHVRKDIPRKVIFWCLGSPDRLIEEIRKAGFLPTADTSQLENFPTGFPVKWSFLIAFLLLWNALFLLDFRESMTPGRFAAVALLLTAAGAAVLLRSESAQKLVMRNGHDFGEIRPAVKLILIITAVMGVAIGSNLWLNIVIYGPER